MTDTEELLNKVKNGGISVDEALLALKKQPFDDLDYAKIDNRRKITKGYGEVIYGAGKTDEQILNIVDKMTENGESNILITRVGERTYEYLKEKSAVEYYPVARIAVVNKRPRQLCGNVVIISAGTSDLPVCEEAAVTAELYGSRVKRVYDVGVAGLHRLLAKIDEIIGAKVIIVVAGMEGALASVVGGLSSCPVIAVPTSVGYGANFEGLSALLAMLNACSSGISVVNIDNGFGAGYLANMINQIGEKQL